MCNSRPLPVMRLVLIVEMLFVSIVAALVGGCEENGKIGGDEADHENAVGSPRDHPDLGIGLLNLAGSEERRGNGILHEAAKSGRSTDLENFLSEMNIDAPNNIGETALHLAAEFEHAKDVAILLRNGATIQVSQR